MPLVRAFWLAALWLIAQGSWAGLAAEGKTLMRVTAGDHESFGRLVIDGHGAELTISRDGDRVWVRLDGDPTLAPLPPLPRNVLALRAAPGGVELTVAHGATVTDSKAGRRVVLDISPPDAASPGVTQAGTTVSGPPPRAPPAAVPAVREVPPAPPPPDKPPDKPAVIKPALNAGNGPVQAPAFGVVPRPPRIADSTVPVVAVTPEAPPVPAEPARPQTGPPAGEKEPEAGPATDATQVWPVIRDAAPSGPVALVATRARLPDGLTGTAIQVPFAEPVGAAMFSRGGNGYVVFDERRPIDLAALKGDPVFGAAVVNIYAAATVIRLPLPAGHAALLSRERAEWRISVIPASPRPTGLAFVAANGALTIAAEAVGQAVTIPDPWTGGTLWIGTQRKPGQAMLIEQHMPELILPATGQGLVVEPLSDAISLRITRTGFVISGGDNGLALSPPPPMAEAMLAAARLTRRFEFPGQTTDALVWRAKQQAVAAAIASPLARGPKRRALAQTLLGLGMGVEAQTLTRLAAKDDPREAASPEAIGLGAIGALLAGRFAESGDLADPRLNGTDEIALWRALQTAMTDEGAPQAAMVLAATAPLLFTYPEEMRRRVLPLALETMVLGGETAPAEHLLTQRPNDPDLAYARALLRQALGDQDGALKLLDEVANSRSPFDHARAAVRAIELRLAAGQLNAKGAADALDKVLYAWRGDGRDLALRRRIADLRRQDGAWREAFALLRGAKTDFPAHAQEIDRQMKEAFAALPNDPSIETMPPTDVIALLDENAALLPEGPEGEPMRARLAEKLMALDLPKQADPILAKLMRAAPIGPGRAGFGATLATLRLHENDGDGALVALSESNAADMPGAVQERRAMIAAQVEAKRGHALAAVEALAPLKTRAADEMRATILEQAKNWPAAQDALTILAARLVPESGMLNDEQRRVMLRLATAAAHAGDESALAALRARMGTRIGTGPQADMFRLLTEAPVRGTADLARARSEMGLARAIAAAPGAEKPMVK